MFADITAEIPKLLFLAVVLGVLVYLALWINRRFRARANRFGYDGILGYFRAIPRCEAEKIDAVNLGMQGVVFCLLGIVVFPLLLFGIFPLYYGMRKLLIVTLNIGTGLPPDVQ